MTKISIERDVRGLDKVERLQKWVNSLTTKEIIEIKINAVDVFKGRVNNESIIRNVSLYTEAMNEGISLDHWQALDSEHQDELDNALRVALHHYWEQSQYWEDISNEDLEREWDRYDLFIKDEDGELYYDKYGDDYPRFADGRDAVLGASSPSELKERVIAYYEKKQRVVSDISVVLFDA